jgi:hypothetical protein
MPNMNSQTMWLVLSRSFVFVLLGRGLQFDDLITCGRFALVLLKVRLRLCLENSNSSSHNDTTEGNGDKNEGTREPET